MFPLFSIFKTTPGMKAFIRIMVELDVKISLYSKGNTVHEKCVKVLLIDMDAQGSMSASL